MTVKSQFAPDQFRRLQLFFLQVHCLKEELEAGS